MVQSLIATSCALLLLGLSGSATAQVYVCGGLPENALGQTVFVNEVRVNDRSAATHRVQLLICADRTGCKTLFTAPGGQLRSFGWISPVTLQVGLESLQQIGLELTINVVQVERHFMSDVAIREIASGASGEAAELQLYDAQKCVAAPKPDIRTEGR